MVYSPDGKTLALTNNYRTVQLWSVEDQRLVQTLEGHGGSVNSVAFSPDGQTLASVGSDSALCLWSVVPGQFVSRHEGFSIPSGSDPFFHRKAFSNLSASVLGVQHLRNGHLSSLIRKSTPKPDCG